MKVEWMNHTGFVVSNLERSLEFYRDLLGLEVERDQILEGEFISQLVGYPDARLHIVYLGIGDITCGGVDSIPESGRRHYADSRTQPGRWDALGYHRRRSRPILY